MWGTINAGEIDALIWPPVAQAGDGQGIRIGQTVAEHQRVTGCGNRGLNARKRGLTRLVLAGPVVCCLHAARIYAY